MDVTNALRNVNVYNGLSVLATRHVISLATKLSAAIGIFKKIKIKIKNGVSHTPVFMILLHLQNF